jgi:hypothetical protein
MLLSRLAALFAGEHERVSLVPAVTDVWLSG